MSGPRFSWTDERTELARRLYVDEGQGPTIIAPQIGGGCARHHVTNKARKEGWTQARTPEQTLAARQASLLAAYSGGKVIPGAFVWTPDRVEQLRQHYVVDGLQPVAVAAKLGEGATRLVVSRKLAWLGWTRPARAAARAVKIAAKAKFLGEGRALPPDVRAAIDAAIAAGKVTRLPSGLASGLSALEQQFHAATPVVSMRQSIQAEHDAAKHRARAG